MSDKAQLVVVGGGPGGYAAAFLAADLGMSVTLIDLEKNPGGVCLHRGCIPSKALLHGAKIIQETRESAAFGITFGEPQIDLAAFRGWKNAVVAKLTGGTGALVKARKIKYLQGRATFKSADSLEVELVSGGRETVSFEKAIIATGSRPTKIRAFDIGSKRVMDSTDALELEDIPGSLLVVGGGYIGLELGTAYAALGSKVTVVEATSGILLGADRDLVSLLQKSLEKKFEKIMLDTKVTSMKEVEGGVLVGLEGKDAPSEATFDKVLVAVGRTPNTQEIGLENLGIETDKRGFISVDPQRKTKLDSIYAIGDVAGEPMLAHKASHEGRTAVEAIAGHKVAFEPNAIPAVIFTDPEIAWAGLTETEAQKSGRNVKVTKFPWAASGRAITLDRTDGLTKLILDPETEQVLGVGIAGPGAGEMIAEGTLAIEMAATARDIALTIHSHPTLGETVMEAAEMFYGLATHVKK
jgi:dihydrolipoamide dehydrogenase